MTRPRARRAGLRLVPLLALAGLLTPLRSAASAAPPECFDYALSVRTLHVGMDPAKNSYQAGTVATIHTTVTRPAHEDPAGLGQQTPAPTSSPAAGAGVGVSLKISGLNYVETSVTNEAGKANVEIRIPSTAPAGKVTATGFAWSALFTSPCVWVEEFGRVQVSGLIDVTR